MADIRANYETPPKERRNMNVHLFNCDRTYKFDAVHKLLKDVEEMSEYRFEVEDHYFPLPKMAETCAQVADYKMDFAVFVVHANESRLSLNEERAGIGYAKIYRALLRATGNRVLIVIGGDDNYKSEENSQVLSRWAKMKISSQFSPEYLDGRKSFIFSWEKQHRYIHKDALLHFLDATKQGEIFVPKPRPLPADSSPKDRAKEQAQAQATPKKATHSQLSLPRTEPKPDLSAQRESVKPSPVIGPLPTEDTKTDHLSKENPRSQSSSFPLDVSCPNQTYNTEQWQKPTAQTNTPKVHPHTPSGQSSNIYPSTSLKETKKHPPAPQGRYQEPIMEKRKEEVPLTPVNVAIIECYVSDESSQVAHTFFFQVAKRLSLKPFLLSIHEETPRKMVEKLIDEARHRSFSFVVLLVDKKILGQISEGKDLSSYTNLMEETQAHAGSQAILIVCNDQDTIAREELQSQSVNGFLRQVGQVKRVAIDPDRWVTLSWNECDPNFTTHEYETYLVRLVQMAEARKEEESDKRAVPATRQSYLEATERSPGLSTWPPANQSERPTGYGPSDYSSMTPAAPQAVHKGNILWEGTLEYGRVKSVTYQRPDWQPSLFLYHQLYEDNFNKGYREFQVSLNADGSVSVFVDGTFRKFAKALDRFANRFF